MKWVKTPHTDPDREPPGVRELHEFRNPNPHENAEPCADHMIAPDDEDDTGFTEGATC